jgi:hypothetical protein
VVHPLLWMWPWLAFNMMLEATTAMMQPPRPRVELKLVWSKSGR